MGFSAYWIQTTLFRIEWNERPFGLFYVIISSFFIFGRPMISILKQKGSNNINNNIQYQSLDHTIGLCDGVHLMRSNFKNVKMGQMNCVCTVCTKSKSEITISTTILMLNMTWPVWKRRGGRRSDNWELRGCSKVMHEKWYTNII